MPGIGLGVGCVIGRNVVGNRREGEVGGALGTGVGFDYGLSTGKEVRLS